MAGGTYNFKLKCSQCGYVDTRTRFREVPGQVYPPAFRCPKPGCGALAVKVERQGKTPHAQMNAVRYGKGKNVFGGKPPKQKGATP